MKRQTRYIKGKPDPTFMKRARTGFEDDLLMNSNDPALFETISEYMKGTLDLEDVRNDPDLSKTDEAVKEMIRDYHKNIPGNLNNEKFIRDIFAEGETEEKIIYEISHIKQEVQNSNLNDLSAEWVKEWHEKKQRNGSSDPKTEEIKDFITSSLNSEKSETLNSLKKTGKIHFLRYISLTAAALIGVIILIRSLLPSYSPEKLFNLYYEPINAVSPVTRSLNSNESGNYASAIGSYKRGDYQSAALGFSDAVLTDSSIISPRFFLGLTHLALNNYDQAINLLSGVVNESGEYGKEARWYLGLAYLKTGNKPKASECFEHLAQSAGFYRDRSEKILRRLK